MNTIEHLSTVCVCFAVDNNYAPYLSVTIRSLLHNRRRSLGYDILILCSALSGESKEAILSTVEGESGVLTKIK